MPPGRPSTRTASYFDDDELDLGVGSGSATAFGGGAYQLGEMSKDSIKAELRRMSKELRTLYKESFKEYKEHTTLPGHAHLAFVTSARKLAVKASKKLRSRIMKDLKVGTWKKASPDQKTAVKHQWQSEQRSNSEGLVQVVGLHDQAVQIKHMWTSHPAPSNVPHHQHHVPTGTVTKYHELPINHGEDMYKIGEVLHWCRQATSMLMTIGTRSGGQVDKVMARNVERARDLRGKMYRLRHPEAERGMERG
jgi:hypothetical protein